MSLTDIDHLSVHEGFHPQFHTGDVFAEVDRSLEERQITPEEAKAFLDEFNSAHGEAGAADAMDQFWQTHHGSDQDQSQQGRLASV